MERNSSPQPCQTAEALGKFVREQNIAHYRKCLAEATDQKRRQVLLRLLAGELSGKAMLK